LAGIARVTDGAMPDWRAACLTSFPTSKRFSLPLSHVSSPLRVLRAGVFLLAEDAGQGDAKVFKKYSQMKLQMKREALEKMNRLANEMLPDSDTAVVQ